MGAKAAGNKERKAAADQSLPGCGEQRKSIATLGAGGGISARPALHRLLQMLPLAKPDQRETLALEFLRHHQPEKSVETCRAEVQEVLRVINDPVFAEVFSENSRAEVPVIGRIDGKRISGQIDRLAVTEKEVLIIDYKTNRPPPEKAEDVSPTYLAQMAAYRALLEKIYPGRTVRCALLWTHSLRLMELPDAFYEAGPRDSARRLTPALRHPYHSCLYRHPHRSILRITTITPIFQESFMGQNTVAVTDGSFENDVLKSGKPVLVDFWAEWCGPCKQIGPVLEDVAGALGDRLTVAKVNIDENPMAPSKYGVRGIPTLMLFKGGQLVDTKVGAMPKSQLVSWLEGALK